MNNVNPLKPFCEFLPKAPMWLRIALYTLRFLLLMLPALGVPSLVSCIGATTNISADIEGVAVGVVPNNSGIIDLPSSSDPANEATEENDIFPAEDDADVLSYHQIL